MLEDARLATEFADEMLQKGIYVIGFSFPVVPKGVYGSVAMSFLAPTLVGVLIEIAALSDRKAVSCQTLKAMFIDPCVPCWVVIAHSGATFWNI